LRAYDRVESLIGEGRCVILDGGVATELQRRRPQKQHAPEPELWGTWALYRAPQAVLDVHRSYVEAGSDVISTNTWSILSASEFEQRGGLSDADRRHWMDIARLGIRLAREAAEQAGREGECAVAFTISEEVNSPHRHGTLDLLSRVFQEERPDLILAETLTLVREPDTFETVERLLATGIPVWLSFRRCRHGVCGVFGQHWGPPEGDLFGRVARRFEEMGVGALLINCLPIDHVTGMVSWLRDFTGIPLGVYPNLGHLTGELWRYDDQVGPKEYAEHALAWRAEGAQIVGGCCGTSPEHIAEIAQALEGVPEGRERPLAPVLDEAPEPPAEPWVDDRGKVLFPLPLPRLIIEPGVFVPTAGSYLVWKYLFTTGLGEGRSCLDVGCGSGILSTQLALNGAASVHAIDIDENAVANTLSNAFRNGVADRVTGELVDLYQWEPDRRFELIVASLYQMPVDPFEEPTGHRPLDYWGRTLLDHMLRLLGRLLEPEGTAYVMQLSIIGQQATARLLADQGLKARVVDVGFFPFEGVFEENRMQIERVEQFSDAYHFTVADRDVMVAYLLEITHA
jgi:S-methylmethionine-dependent homocysteine/selenocysteine methylase/SAM-dependent methyltransferase